MDIRGSMIYGNSISKFGLTYLLVLIYYPELDQVMLCLFMMIKLLFLEEYMISLGNWMIYLYLILRKWNGLVLMKIVQGEKINNCYLQQRIINKILKIQEDNLENQLELVV